MNKTLINEMIEHECNQDCKKKRVEDKGRVHTWGNSGLFKNSKILNNFKTDHEIVENLVI